jgi:hypothetical protein
MIEEAWLSSTDTAWMLFRAEVESSFRKLALFQLECSRQLCERFPAEWTIHELLREAYLVVDDPTIGPLASIALLAHEYAEATATRLNRLVEQSRGKMRRSVQEASREGVAANLLHMAVSAEGWWRQVTEIDDPLLAAQYAALEGQREAVCRENLHLLRCIVGNPFRPVTIHDSWRSEAVVALAAAIYTERAFDRLPILADALQEAECDHPDVLEHCRRAGPHTRGCWVVDSVLGKS